MNETNQILCSCIQADVPAIVVSEGLSDSEDDKELLDVKVAGSAYSISITEVVQEKFNEDLDLKTPAKDQGSMINIKTLFSSKTLRYSRAAEHLDHDVDVDLKSCAPLYMETFRAYLCQHGSILLFAKPYYFFLSHTCSNCR